MSTDPTPSVTRGDLTLQPSYFTSSLFVNPLREDIARLIQAYVEQYLGYSGGNPIANVVGSENTRNDATSQGPQTQDQVAANTEHSAEDAALVSTSDTSILLPNESMAYSTSLPTIGQSSAPSRAPVLQATSTVVVHPQPFALFKQLWSSQGWCWLHFKVFDGRARESFLTVVLRLFSGITSVISL
jgi:hypothetical protein